MPAAKDQSDTLLDERAPPAAVKAERIVVLREMSVADAFAAVIAACIRHFRSTAQLAISNRDPGALHQSRVALRRLASAFLLFRSAVDGTEFDRLRDELRWIMSRLGEARDLDVVLQRELPDDERTRLEAERERAYARAIEALDSSRCQLLVADVLAWRTHGDWRSRKIAQKRIVPYARRRIDRLWSKVARSERISRMTERQRHRLRTRTKTLRYALRFVAALHADARKRRKKFSRDLKNLQQALGELNDRAVVRMLVAATPSPVVAERALLDDAEDAIGRLREIGPYWRKASGRTSL
jgi:triphosphatase